MKLAEQVDRILYSKNEKGLIKFWFQQTKLNQNYHRLRKQWRFFALFLAIANYLLYAYYPESAKFIYVYLEGAVALVYRLYFWIRWYSALPPHDKQYYNSLKRVQLVRWAGMLAVAVIVFLVVVLPLIYYALAKYRVH